LYLCHNQDIHSDYACLRKLTDTKAAIMETQRCAVAECQDKRSHHGNTKVCCCGMSG